MSNSTSSSGGMGIFGWLTILFVGLKLTGYINWSWSLVLSPIWVPFAILVAVLGISSLCIAIAKRWDK
jgi:F0F1-type ATP synthase membrane subunit a